MKRENKDTKDTNMPVFIRINQILLYLHKKKLNGVLLNLLKFLS